MLLAEGARTGQSGRVRLRVRVSERLHPWRGKRTWLLVVYLVGLAAILVLFVWPWNRSIAVALMFLYAAGPRYLTNLWVARDRAANRDKTARHDTA
jgi:hypothetical protein